MDFNRPIPDHKPPSKTSSGIETLVQAEKLMQIAILLPSAAFIGWLAGAWLDSKLHTAWIGIAGVLFGGVSGLVYVVRLAINTGNQVGDDGKGDGGNGAGSGKPGAGDER
jgi:F0F1-type ATP synthase assembly protein I